MTRRVVLEQVENEAARPRPPMPSTARWCLLIFGSVFLVLAALELSLYSTGRVYTAEERQRRRAEALALSVPDDAAKAADRLAEFTARLERLASQWGGATGVPLDSLDSRPQLPPTVRELLADPAAATAAQCWDRLARDVASFRERHTLAARLRQVSERVRAGNIREEDAVYLTQSLRKIEAWSKSLDSHERCAAHIRDLLRVRALEHSPVSPAGGSP